MDLPPVPELVFSNFSNEDKLNLSSEEKEINPLLSSLDIKQDLVSLNTDNIPNSDILKEDETPNAVFSKGEKETNLNAESSLD